MLAYPSTSEEVTRSRVASSIRGLVMLVATVVIVLAPWVAQAEKVTPFEVDHVKPRLRTGLLTNSKPRLELGYLHEIRFEDADWMRLTFAAVKLGSGDYIRIFAPETGVEQILTSRDPQYGNPRFEGKIYSARFAGGALDVSLHLAPGSKGAGFELDEILVARLRPDQIQTICGGTDDRTALSDPCAMRIVDSQGGWGSGFMISNNWLITANHVMTAGPWTVERNVPASNAGSGAIQSAGVNDQFALPNLTNSTLSGSSAFGNDWAVINLPNNAAGAPGAGCTVTYHCGVDSACAGVTNLTVDGFGIDSENAKNGTLQTHSGPCVAGTNATSIQYQVDTTANNSGSRVTDQNGRIVAIHTTGGCTGGAPETGANGGTLITNPGLLTAIQARCGFNPCPPVSVETVSWSEIKTLFQE